MLHTDDSDKSNDDSKLADTVQVLVEHGDNDSITGEDLSEVK